MILLNTLIGFLTRYGWQDTDARDFYAALVV